MSCAGREHRSSGCWRFQRSHWRTRDELISRRALGRPAQGCRANRGAISIKADDIRRLWMMSEFVGPRAREMFCRAAGRQSCIDPRRITCAGPACNLLPILQMSFWRMPALPVVAGILLCAAASATAQTSGILREVYYNISGNAVSDLLNAPAFPNSPNEEFIESAFEAPSNF